MLGTRVVGIVGAGLSGLTLLKEEQPIVIIIDVNLGEDEVLAFLKDVGCLHPDIRLVVLSQRPDISSESLKTERMLSSLDEVQWQISLTLFLVPVNRARHAHF